MFGQVFRVDTSKLLFSFFYASDSQVEPKRGTAEYDRICKFRPVLEYFNRTWSKQYKLGCEVSIDESIVGFKRRHSLLNCMHIRMKRHHQ